MSLGFPMRQPMEEPTFNEKRGLFEIYYLARSEAMKGLPLRKGHDVSTTEQRVYEKDYVAGLAYRRTHPWMISG